MYSYFQAYVLPKEFDSQFITEDISGYTVDYIFNNYSKVYLSLNYTYSSGQVLADIDQLKGQYRYSTQTLTSLISTLSDGYLSTIQEIPVTPVNYTRYISADLAGYSLSYNNNNLILNNPNVEGSTYPDYCLTTVNGYIMPTQYTNNQIAVSMGTNPLNYLRVGIISFENIGQITTTPITTANIVLSGTRSPSELLYLKTNVNPSYITFLVLNGYLIAPTSGGFYPVGNSIFALSLEKLGYGFKLLESRYKQYYNYNLITEYLPSELVGNLDPNKISIPLIKNPLFINEYLTLPNTFLVTIPATNIVLRTKNILNTELVNSIRTRVQPTNILVGSQGKIIDYYYTYKNGQYIVSNPNMTVDNYVDSHGIDASKEFISDQRIPNSPLVRSALFFKQYGFY